MFDRNLLVVGGLAPAATASFGQGTFHEDERNLEQDARRSIRHDKDNGHVD